MDPNSYRRALLGLQVLHSTHASVEEREGAHRFLEEFKEKEDCVLYANYILSVESIEHSDIVRHFALHVLESVVNRRWNTLQTDQQNELRNNLVNLMSDSSRLLQGAEFIKQKLIQIIADVAERQFPQHWPDFVDQMLGLCLVGDSQAEIVLLIFKSMAEDCVNSDFNLPLPASRRQEIIEAFNIYFPQLFPGVYRLLEAQYGIFKSSKNPACLSLIRATLQMMREFIRWAQFTSLVDDQMNFVYVFVALLSDKDLRTDALECLGAFFKKKVDKEERTVFVGVFNLLVNHVVKLPATTSGVEDFTFLRHLADVLCQCAVLHINIYLLDISNEENDVLRRFIEYMTSLFNHPSITIAITLLPFWTAILKDPRLSQQSYFSNIRSHLWTSVMDKSFKFGFPDEDLSPTCEYSRLEYEDDTEYLHAFGQLKTRLAGLIHLLVQQDLRRGLAMIVEQYETILVAHSAGKDHLDANGYCTESSIAFRYQEGISSLFDMVIKNVQDFKGDQVQQLLNAILAKIVAIETIDPLLLYRQMLIFSSFKDYYLYDASLLPQVLDKLLRTCTFRTPQEIGIDIYSLSSSTVAARRRALSSLVAISKANSSQILPVFSQLCSRVVKLLQEEAVLDMEKILLYEMLVLVSNSLPDVEQQRNFLNQVLAQPLTLWTSPRLTHSIANMENFIYQMSQEETQEKSSQEDLLAAPSILSTLLGIVKRIQSAEGSSDLPRNHPLSGFWQHILPNLFQILNLIHNFWEANTKSSLLQHPTASSLLCITDDELKSLLPVGEESKQEFSHVKHRWSKWQRKIRDCGYHLMSIAISSQNICVIPSMNDMLLKLVSSGIHAMEHRHLRNLISSIIIPSMKYCPMDSYKTLLEPMLHLVLNHLVERLDVCWGLKDGNVAIWSITTTSINESTLEVIQAKLISDLTKSAMDFVEAMIDSRALMGTKAVDPVSTDRDRALQEYVLFQSKHLPIPIFLFLTRALYWPETATCNRTVEILDTVVPVIRDHPEYFTIIGREVFGSVLWILFNEQPHAEDSNVKWVLVSLLKNIYCRLVLGLLPIEECKGIDPVCQPEKPSHMTSQLPHQLLASLPGVTKDKLEALDKDLRHSASERDRKQIFREFLKASMLLSNKENNMVGGRKQIQDLPENFINKPKKTTQELSEFGLSSLYNQNRNYL